MRKSEQDYRVALLDAEKKASKIVDDAGIDSAWRAFKKPMEGWLKEQFMNGRETLKEKSPPFQVMQLKNAPYNDFDYTRPPCNDHSEMYLWRGKPLFYVYHPYDGVDEKELAEFCEQHGFGYEISSRSWHFVGKTVRVMIFDPERRAEYEEAAGKSARHY